MRWMHSYVNILLHVHVQYNTLTFSAAVGVDDAKNKSCACLNDSKTIAMFPVNKLRSSIFCNHDNRNNSNSLPGSPVAFIKNCIAVIVGGEAKIKILCLNPWAWIFPPWVKRSLTTFTHSACSHENIAHKQTNRLNLFNHECVWLILRYKVFYHWVTCIPQQWLKESTCDIVREFNDTVCTITYLDLLKGSHHRNVSNLLVGSYGCKQDKMHGYIRNTFIVYSYQCQCQDVSKQTWTVHSTDLDYQEQLQMSMHLWICRGRYEH